jgi:hypothetical protein
MECVIDAREEIEGLVGFEGRGPGTDAERRAAVHLRERLDDIGREAELEPTWIRPNWPLAYTAYALLGVVGSVISTATATAGAIVAGVALLAAIGDAGGRIHTGRRLTGRRGSQNVISREDGGRPGTLVLVAHYDSARSGFAYGFSRIGRRAGPFRVLVLALAVVTAATVLGAAGVDGVGVSAIQFAATVVLIVALPLLVDIGLSDPVPGASDNASGVATVLRLAERYGDDLEHFDVWVLFTGGEEAFGEGMREWTRRRRRELDARTTVFLNVDTVGSGTVRYAEREGPLLPGRYGVRPTRIRAPNDAVAARRAGFPAITVTCRDERDDARHLHQPADTPERVEDDALARAFGFCSELIELIDEEIGPDLSAAEPAAARFRSA